MLDAGRRRACSPPRPTDFKDDPATAGDLPEPAAQPYGVGDRLVQKDLAQTLRQISAGAAPPASTRARSRDAIVGVERGRQGHHHAGRSRPVHDARAGAGRMRLPRLSRRLGAAAELGRRRHLRDPQRPRGLSAARTGASARRRRCTYQIEAMRHAYVDRNSYLGDPDFVKNPLDRLLDKGYAAKIRAAIDPDKAGVSHGPEARRRRRTRAATRRTTRSSTARATRSSVTYTLNDWFGAQGDRRRAPACCSTTRWTTSPPSSACRTSTAWCRARPTRSRRASGR